MQFHHTTQSTCNLKIYELLIYVIFHLLFPDDDGPETTGTENAGNRGSIHFLFSVPGSHSHHALSLLWSMTDSQVFLVFNNLTVLYWPDIL